VSHDNLAVFILPKRELIESAARKFYRSLTAPAELSQGANPTLAAEQGRDWLTNATTLSQMLLAPAAAKLGDNKRLIIVADGAVQYVPFAALPEPNPLAKDSKASTSRAQAYQPLIIKHEIVSLPSASTIAVLRAESPSRHPASKTVAVIADPVFEPTDLRVKQADRIGTKTDTPTRKGDSALRSLVETLNGPGAFETGQPIPRLPYSRREALSIAALVPETQRKLALDFEADYATAASPQLGEYRLVHFATHGLLNSTHPELSGILLSLVDEAGNPQPQGLLRLGEIYNLKLPVELIVLSGCQTALGQDVQGEGLVGLTRGFMYAGSPRVIASLWKVDDMATADLMKSFYQGMLGRQKLSAAAALRQAQRQMWQTNKGRNPFYWAAFVLQGEWR
jgi:CHAT domain-containing protein